MIRAGIGGWTYEPWRDTFHSRFTFKTFRKWFEETPDGFVFSLKAPRFAVNRRVLGEAGPSIAKFFESGVSELKSKLGPILWQPPPFKKYDAEDIETFLTLLPKTIDGIALRHALEVRHESFQVQDFILQARKTNVAVVIADKPKYPLGDFLNANMPRICLSLNFP